MKTGYYKLWIPAFWFCLTVFVQPYPLKIITDEDENAHNKAGIAMHKDEYYVLRIKEKNLTLLVHELSHIVDFLEKHLQIEDSSWEFKAYILDWLFDEISKKFKGKKKLPIRR